MWMRQTQMHKELTGQDTLRNLLSRINSDALTQSSTRISLCGTSLFSTFQWTISKLWRGECPGSELQNNLQAYRRWAGLLQIFNLTPADFTISLVLTEILAHIFKIQITQQSNLKNTNSKEKRAVALSFVMRCWKLHWESMDPNLNSLIIEVRFWKFLIH